MASFKEIQAQYAEMNKPKEQENTYVPLDGIYIMELEKTTYKDIESSKDQTIWGVLNLQVRIKKVEEGTGGANRVAFQSYFLTHGDEVQVIPCLKVKTFLEKVGLTAPDIAAYDNSAAYIKDLIAAIDAAKGTIFKGAVRRDEYDSKRDKVFAFQPATLDAIVVTTTKTETVAEKTEDDVI